MTVTTAARRVVTIRTVTLKAMANPLQALDDRDDRRQAGRHHQDSDIESHGQPLTGAR